MPGLQFVRHNDFVAYFRDSKDPFAFQAATLRAVDCGVRQGDWDRAIVAIDGLGRLREFRFSKGKLQEPREFDSAVKFGFVTSIAMASDNRTLAFTGSDFADEGILWLCDIESNAIPRRVVASRDDRLSGVDFIQDSVVTSGLDGAIRVWKLPEAKVFAESFTESAITHLYATLDFVFTCAGRVITAWRIDEISKALVRVKDVDAPFDVVAIDVAGDGRFAAVGSADGAVCVINMEIPEIVWSSKSHDAPIRDVRFTPSKRYLLSSSLNGLKVHEFASDPNVATLVDGRSEFGLCQGAMPFEVDPFASGQGAVYALYVVGSPKREEVDFQMGIVRLWLQDS